MTLLLLFNPQANPKPEWLQPCAIRVVGEQDAELLITGAVEADILITPWLETGMPIYVGAKYGLTVKVKSVTGALVDPLSITAHVRNNVTEKTYVYGTDAELTRTSAGVYQLAIDIDTPDEWRVAFATFAPTGVETFDFEADSTIIDDPDL